MNRMHILYCFYLLLVFVAGSSCTHLFYQPTKKTYPFLAKFEAQRSEGFFKSFDGTQLHYVHFKSPVEKPRGIFVHFHGNGANLSSQFMGLAWVIEHGFDLFVFDYRGYGRSAGKRGHPEGYHDAVAAFQFATKLAQARGLAPIYYGQSLGGALLLRLLQDHAAPVNTKAVFIEGAFSNYQRVARQVLARTWLTWPIQWMAYLFIDSSLDPATERASFPHSYPIVLIYAENDRMVSMDHGRILFSKISEPKDLWVTAGRHMHSLFVENAKYQKKVIALIGD